MVALNQVPNAVMMLVMAGLIFGAGLLALSQFSTTLTGVSASAVSNVTTGIGNFASQMPVIGTILGVAVLITVVIVAFAFGGRFAQ